MDWAIFVIPTLVGCLLHEVGHAYQFWRETGNPIKTVGIGLPFWPMWCTKLGEIDLFISPWLIALVVSQSPLPAKVKGISLAKRWSNWLETLTDSQFLAKPPGERYRIALAGPAVNIVLAILALGVMLVAMKSQNFSLVQVSLAWVVINAVLGLFNLLPIPPLDGGHILFAAIDRWWPVEGMAKTRRVWWANMFSLVGLALILVMPIWILLTKI